MVHTMALLKGLDCRSSVHEVPAMPQVPRSAKGKRSTRRKVEENEMSAFDLLVSVAGNLLTEREFSMDLHDKPAEDAIKQEQLSGLKSFKTEPFDQHDCNLFVSGTDVITEKTVSRDMKEIQFLTKATSEGSNSDLMNPNKLCSSAPANICSVVNNKCETGSGVAGTIEKGNTSNNSHSSTESYESKVNCICAPLHTEQTMAENFSESNKLNICQAEDPMDVDTKPLSLLSSDSSGEAPFCRNDNKHINSVAKSEDGMRHSMEKDDDERSSACTYSSTLSYTHSKLQNIEDRKIRKRFSSKYWKTAPKLLCDEDFSTYNVDVKPAVRCKKMCYTRQRTNRTSFKRRQVFENSSLSTSSERRLNEQFFNIYEKGSVKIDGNNGRALRENGVTSGQKLSQEARDCHVKLSIKSFKVPELFIEIPETATVASLKKTVMEAVTTIIGGGVHIGLLLQGRKIRDDNKTLHQAGILNEDKLDNLGFILEPDTAQAPPSITSFGDPSFHDDDIAEPLARIPPIDSPLTDQFTADSSSQLIPASCPESDDSSHTPVEALDKIKANSRALVVVPPADVEPLAIIPSRKSKRSEVVQRRVRRPFTVAEVEALVQAVEKLGTGRWRDVKLRAFDNAKHRTYVDLKDKWKTLVHTARISPQQRRGEPVPQELLDRVLSAHAYWSQHQATLQVKSSAQPVSCLS